jgi:hypothetical protein
MGGVDDALDEEVIEEGAGGCGSWCACGAIAVVVAGVVDDIVEDDEDDDWNRCSALLSPDCRSIFWVF